MFQFFHDQYSENRKTVAVYVCQKNDLLNIMDLYSPTKSINIQCGITYVHDRDRYVKKIGRFHSTKKTFVETFKINNIFYVDDYVRITLRNEQPNRDIKELVFKVFPFSKKPHLVDVITKEDLYGFNPNV